MHMSPFEFWLIVGGLCVMLVSFRNPRGAAWIMLILADLIGTTAYWKAGLPYGEVITGGADALVCLGIYFAGKFRWEMIVYLLFQASFMVSLIYLGLHTFGIIAIDQDAYSSVLEAINWLAFLAIGGNSALQLFGRNNVDLPYFSRPWRRRFSALVFPAYREARAYSPRRSA